MLHVEIEGDDKGSVMLGNFQCVDIWSGKHWGVDRKDFLGAQQP